MFQLNLDWNVIWTKNATKEEVPEERRKESIYNALSQVATIMQNKFGREETMEYNLLNFQENVVLIEYPLLEGLSQGELEAVTEELLQTMFV